MQQLNRLPDLRLVGTLRELPNEVVTLGGDGRDGRNPPVRQLHLVRTIRVRMSWDDSTRLYLYRAAPWQ